MATSRDDLRNGAPRRPSEQHKTPHSSQFCRKILSQSSESPFLSVFSAWLSQRLPLHNMPKPKSCSSLLNKSFCLPVSANGPISHPLREPEDLGGGGGVAGPYSIFLSNSSPVPVAHIPQSLFCCPFLTRPPPRGQSQSELAYERSEEFCTEGNLVTWFTEAL